MRFALDLGVHFQVESGEAQLRAGPGHAGAAGPA